MSALRVSAGERKGITGDERIFLETTGAVLSISHDMMEARGRGVLSHYCRAHGGAKKSCQKYFQIWKHIMTALCCVMCVSRLRPSRNPDCVSVMNIKIALTKSCVLKNGKEF